MGNQSNAKRLLGIALLTLLTMSVAIGAVDACGNKCKTPTTYYGTCRPSTICGSTPAVTQPTTMPAVTQPTTMPNGSTSEPVKADFVFSKQPAENSAEVVMSFIDESTGDPQSWKWDFGDGGTSTDNNPSHVYQDGLDTHKVTLQVSDGNTDTISKEVDTSSQNVSTT
jgi:PKD repeat protein